MTDDANQSSIALLNLARQHASIADELMAGVAEVAGSQSFVLGEIVARFERKMGEYIGVRHAIGVASGTDALYLALRLLDLQTGDEVVTSPFSFFATAGAIHNAGGRVVFADIEPGTFNLDPDAVAAAISERTRAIVPVHLFGQMAEMEKLTDVAARHRLWVIEDAAQAIGAKALVGGAWRSAGAVGTLGCLSFYPTKNLGGWGDGGMITTDDDALAERLRRLRVHGENWERGRYVHEEIGTNSRLDALQAAVLEVKLRRLPGWTEGRRVRAARYDRALETLAGVRAPAAPADRFHVYCLYTLRAERRDELKQELSRHGIASGIYYPLPLHLQPCFSGLGYREGDFPEAEKAAREVLSIPLFPELTSEEQGRVIEALEESCGPRRR